MADITGNIGRRFERYFQSHFPGFESHTNDGRNVPDFYNRDGNFWVEAKVGNRRWGPDLKHYQRDSFGDMGRPIVFCFGLHDFDDALERLTGKSDEEMRQILGHNMRIEEIFFVTRGVVDAVLAKETRVSATTGRVYCTIKRPIIRNIFSGESFRRFGEKVDSAQIYYGYDEAGLEIYRPRDIRKTKVPISGIILDPKKDQAVAEYFGEQGII
jgi:hypothetical protein